MVKGKNIPDAWDDDWESQADKLAREEEEAASSSKGTSDEPVVMSKSERMAKHAEQQRKLWEAAEQPPDQPFFVAATSNVPLTTGFKPAMKLLSRKPAPKTVMRKDPVTGLEQLTLQDDDDDEADDARKHQPTPEEIRLRQQRELEEKQRRYEEARAKIFGGSNPSSGQSTPGNVTPPRSDSRQGQRGRGRGRGGLRGESRSDIRQQQDFHRQDTTSGRRQQPTSQPGTRELFDPNYSAKPGLNIQKRGDGSSSPRPSSSREEDQVIRAPRGPDGSGRGGFGFARRGGPKAD
ncbi:hypothetical protein GE09DRAFT_789348 [Coniochaeta sp. 2T2.1]|nr:hypothetical protein GE09DRAFT_789348 [Coniochaeta sp. 2T2.1]